MRNVGVLNDPNYLRGYAKFAREKNGKHALVGIGAYAILLMILLLSLDPSM